MLLAAPPTIAQADRVHRIGGFTPSSADGMAQRATFRDAMRKLGYAEGRNVIYVESDAGADQQKLAQAAAELIALKPDVLVAWESLAIALHAKTRSIPIVLTGGFDPVGAGLAHSLRRPGMNVTGVTQLNAELPAKHIELLMEILPRASRVGMLFDTNSSGCALVERSVRAAAQRIGKTLVVYKTSSKADIERAFAQMANDRPDALLPCPSFVLLNHRDLLFSEGLRLRIPWTSFVVDNLPLGVLFAHSSSRNDEYRAAAAYVDRVLRGAKPEELPIEQPSRFELAVNLKTAKALGITVPRSLLLRADRVIE
jgi:putative ABC transport system substrate-binding protein